MAIIIRNPCYILLFATLTILSERAAAMAESTVAITNIPPKIHDVPVRDTVADWNGQGLLIRALAGDSAVFRKSSEFLAAARLGWSEEGLLLHVEVVDNTPSKRIRILFLKAIPSSYS